MGVFRRIGPGGVVAAAFVGPGTVTTATIAGARFGTSLLWCLVFSALATIALQEMAARVGVVARTGLGEMLRSRLGPLARAVATAWVLGALVVGNSAYETGNLLGARLGAAGLSGVDGRAWAPLLGALAFLLLWTGRYRLLERVLVAFVAVMGLAFLATAVAVGPDLGALVRGSVRPTWPESDPRLVLALVGTTIVPYNLFLHASAAAERWRGRADLRAARWDTAVSVSIGVAISAAILVTAAALPRGAPLGSASEMAAALEPTLGPWARAVFSAGLLAAGLSSAITAPLAAAYAVGGALGWGRDLRDARLRGVWAFVLCVGAGLALAGSAPVPAIVFAQLANGLLLPLVVAFLLWAANDRGVLGAHANGWGANVCGIAVWLVTAALGLRSVWALLRA